MADKRRLAAEIDRTLKKVDEGILSFDATLEKFQDAMTQSQREKLGDDLKKEIKKLQRLRDHIKQWQSSQDIKDKDALHRARKEIEQKMEIFKVVERENKTKAYSKEGLMKSGDSNPLEQERLRMREWMQQCISDLNLKTETSEVERDAIKAGKKATKNNLQDDDAGDSKSSAGKSRKDRRKNRRRDREDREKRSTSKKSNERDDSPSLYSVAPTENDGGDTMTKISEIEETIGSHKFHINNLEALMRMLDNGSLKATDVEDANIKRDMECYIDGCDDPTYSIHDADYIYDPYKDMIEKLTVAITAPVTTETEDGRSTPFTLEHQTSNPSSSEQKHQSESQPDNTIVLRSEGLVSDSISTQQSRHEGLRSITSNSEDDRSRTNSGVIRDKELDSNLAGLESITTQQYMATSPRLKTPDNNEVTSSDMSHLQSTHPEMTINTTPPGILPPSSPATNPWTSNTLANQLSQLTVKSVPSSSNDIHPNPDDNEMDFPPSYDLKNPSPPTATTLPASTTFDNPQNVVVLPTAYTGLQQQQSVSIENTALPASSNRSNPQNNNNTTSGGHSAGPSSHSSSSASSLSPSTRGHNTANLRNLQEYQTGHGTTVCQQPNGLNKVHIHTNYVFSPLMEGQPLTSEQKFQLQLVETAHAPGRRPQPTDCERMRTYVPRNHIETPKWHAQHPPEDHDSQLFYDRLTPETLFFVFYYMERTKAQYLAAKALKKQSWRFHQKYLLWFQRHAEPEEITDEYEKGKYVFFDYENWRKRTKEDFKFEYQYLEDRPEI